EYSIRLISFDNKPPHQLRKFSSALTSINGLVISPSESFIATTGVKNGNIHVVSIFDYEMDQNHRHFGCYPCTQVEFTQGGSLLILELDWHRGAIISLIKTSSFPMERIVIARDPHLAQGISLLMPKLVTLDDHSAFAVVSCFDDDQGYMWLFDSQDGKAIAISTLHRRRDGVYYGNHRLPIPPSSANNLCKISGTNVAYVNDNGRIVVLNCSGFMDH
ncbi:15354_t:CDS:1, partial [Acaulospora colombiana]